MKGKLACLVNLANTQEFKNSRIQELRVSRRGTHRSILEYLSSRVLEFLRNSDSFFKTNGRRIVFKRWEIGDPIEAGLSVKCNGFGLFNAGLQAHRVIVKLPC